MNSGAKLKDKNIFPKSIIPNYWFGMTDYKLAWNTRFNILKADLPSSNMFTGKENVHDAFYHTCLFIFKAQYIDIQYWTHKWKDELDSYPINLC